MATLAMVAAAAVGVIAGFGREASIALRFGASASTDGIVVALALPMVTQTMISGPVINGSGVRLLAQAVDRPEFRRRLALLALSGAAPLVLIGLAASAAAPRLALVLAPTLAGGALAVAAALMPYTAAAALLLHVAAVGTAGLNVCRRPVLPAALQAFPALGIVVTIYFFAQAPLAIGYGLLAGCGLLCGLVWVRLWWVLILQPFHSEAPRSSGASDTRTVVVAAAVLMATAVVGQSLAIAERGFALVSGPGTLAAIGYATRLSNLPVVLTAGVLSGVVFVRMASLSHDKRFAGVLREAIMVCVVLMSAVAALIVMHSDLIVRVAFGRGHFGPSAIEATSEFLRVYALVIPLQVINPLLTYALFSQNRAKAAAATNALGAVLNLLILAIAYPVVGSVALPWALLGAALVSTGLQAWLLRDRLLPIEMSKTRAIGAYLALAGLCATIVVLLPVGADRLLASLIASLLIVSAAVGVLWRSADVLHSRWQ